MVAWWGWDHWCGAAVPTLMEQLRRCGAGTTVSNTGTRITCSYWSERRGGICNVMVEEGRCIKFFSVFTYGVLYVYCNLLLAGQNGDKGVRCQKIMPPPPFFFGIFGRHHRPVNLSAPLSPKPKKLW